MDNSMPVPPMLGGNMMMSQNQQKSSSNVILYVMIGVVVFVIILVITGFLLWWFVYEHHHGHTGAAGSNGTDGADGTDGTDGKNLGGHYAEIYKKGPVVLTTVGSHSFPVNSVPKLSINSSNLSFPGNTGIRPSNTVDVLMIFSMGYTAATDTVFSFELVDGGGVTDVIDMNSQYYITSDESNKHKVITFNTRLITLTGNTKYTPRVKLHSGQLTYDYLLFQIHEDPHARL